MIINDNSGTPEDTNPYAPWSPEGNEEQEKVTEEQQQRIAASLPIINDVLDWFDNEIKAFKDPSTITGVNISSNAEQVKSAVLFAQTVIASYESKKEEFMKDFGQYIRKDMPSE